MLKTMLPFLNSHQIITGQFKTRKLKSYVSVALSPQIVSMWAPRVLAPATPSGAKRPSEGLVSLISFLWVYLLQPSI